MKKAYLAAGGVMASLVLVAGVAFAQTAMTSVQVEKDGRVHADHIKVTAVSGNSISVTGNWLTFTLNGTLQTDGNTRIVRSGGHQSSVSEIAVGDDLSIKGVLIGPGITLRATWIKDNSTRGLHRELKGTVTAVNQSSSSFGLSAGSANYTVLVNGSTTFVGKTSTSTIWSDLVTGLRVNVRGWIDTATNVVTASYVKIAK